MMLPVLLLVFFVSSNTTALSPPELLVGIAFDLAAHLKFPGKSTLGILEIGLLQRAMPEYSFRYLQLPRSELSEAVRVGKIDVALDVPLCDSSCEPMLHVVDSAVTSIRSSMSIKDIGDLVGITVLAFEGADLSLGEEFESHFGPDGTDRRDYREFDDVLVHVQRFWDDGYDIAVLDKTTFAAVTDFIGYCSSCVAMDDVFPPRQIVAAFSSDELRQQYKVGVELLCQNDNLQQDILGSTKDGVKVACADAGGRSLSYSYSSSF
jgi:hypothetical protein